jgi:hypothetical protein
MGSYRPNFQLDQRLSLVIHRFSDVGFGSWARLEPWLLDNRQV